MKKLLISFGFSIIILCAGGDVAEAQSDCRDTCMDSKQVCRDSARTAVRGCRMTCRSGDPAERRECRRTCRAAHKESRSTCRGAIEQCHDACVAEVVLPTLPEGSDAGIDPHICVADCKQDLRQCSRQVLEAGQECSVACFELRREDARDCRGSANPLACLLHSFGGFGRCLSGGAQDTHAAGRACLDAFRDCRGDCENPNPYGSASQAFFRQPMGLLD